MKVMIKIALAFIFVTGLSLPVYAAGGDALTIDGSNSGGTDLVFTPSGNTLIDAVTSATAYTIISASAKTTTANGMEYYMRSGYNGYYQKAQAADGALTSVGTTAGAAPTGTWAAMGGGS